MKSEIEQLLKQAVAHLQADGVLPTRPGFEPVVSHSKNPEHGEFASNLALVLSKDAGLQPRQLAAGIVDALPVSPLVDHAEIAGPGFINFFLAQGANTQVVAQILEQTDQFGNSEIGRGERVLIEFVSANPTGPLHVGHGRQAALGDAVAGLLQTQGFSVTREFYYNDAGVQINNLALSVQARARGLAPGDNGWPEQAYNGEYIEDIAKDFLARKTIRCIDTDQVTASGDVEDLESIRRFAVTYLRNEQDVDLKAFGLQFDVFFLESSLYEKGYVDDVVKKLIASGKTFEDDGALWLRTTEFGDDKDRVMRKRDGGYTYFVPDVAYHVNKWKRGFVRAINIQGTDHFGTVARVRAGLQALDMGIPDGYPDYILHYMVKVMRGGQEVKISKRAGSYVTVRDLIEWVGLDAVRFFLVSRRADSQFVFDLDLALSQSDENPVYYVQYAHARICSVFRQLQENNLTHSENNGLKKLDRLTESHETALIKVLTRYPETVAGAALAAEPHQITYYLRELATAFHSYYNALQFLVDDTDLRDARLTLVKACGQVLRNALAIIGVSAPERM